MTAVWALIGVLAAGTFVIKAAGPWMLGSREIPSRLSGTIVLLVPALLAALILEQTFSDRGDLALDARALGVGVAVVALLLRLPLLWVLVLAAGSTALVRVVA
jgi:branched-subunit amino acid transport protein